VDVHVGGHHHHGHHGYAQARCRTVVTKVKRPNGTTITKRVRRCR
jgi:hypothetical protein